MNLRTLPLLACLLLAASTTGASDDGLDHATSGAAAAATNRAALLALLRRTDAPLISGQNIGHAHVTAAGYRNFMSEAAGKLGNRMPLLCGVDYGWDALKPVEITQANTVLIAHWRRGGLVTVSMHPNNPSNQGGVVNSADIDAEDVLRPGTAANLRWMGDLEKAGDGLAVLRAAGIPVLWRPLHESNGKWFWWGYTRITTEQYLRFWRQAYDYLSKKRGLDNLLWVYAANPQVDKERCPPAERYPGEALCDVVGMDCYDDDYGPGTFNVAGSYDQLIALGKPFALCEVGPSRRKRGKLDAMALLAAVRTQCPKARYVLYWQSWKSSGLFGSYQANALADNPNAAEFLADPGVAALKQPP